MALPNDQRQAIAQLKKRLGLDYRTMAEWVGVRHPTLISWVEGDRAPNDPTKVTRLLQRLHEEERRQLTTGEIAAVPSTRLTKPVLPFTVDALRDDMYTETATRSVTFEQTDPSRTYWARPVTSVWLAPYADPGDDVILDNRTWEPSHAIEAKVGDEFRLGFLFRDRSGLYLRSSDPLEPPIPLQESDIRGVVCQRIRTETGDITTTAVYKHGMRHRF